MVNDFFIAMIHTLPIANVIVIPSMLLGHALDWLDSANVNSRRVIRYRSEEQAVGIALFSPGEADTIRSLYEFLIELRTLVEVSREESGKHLDDIARAESTTALVSAVRRLGATTPGPLVASALHDIRGGALTSLFAHMSRVRRAPERLDSIEAVRNSARDHAKIMRNVVAGLDDRAREADLATVTHTSGELAIAMSDFAAEVGGRDVTTRVRCADSALSVAVSCVEYAAVDRIAYNLLNNAAAHAVQPVVEAAIDRRGLNLRVVVANAVAPTQRLVLERALTESPATLFGDFTTTRSGRGLQIARELVGRAYDVEGTDQLVANGYLGARLLADTFFAWFHWPVAS